MSLNKSWEDIALRSRAGQEVSAPEDGKMVDWKEKKKETKKEKSLYTLNQLFILFTRHMDLSLDLTWGWMDRRAGTLIF